MTYFNNLLRHSFAWLTGDGLSNALARDFWPAEDLWNPEIPIRKRWLKLVWVYSASSIAQATLPMIILGTLVDLFYRHVSLLWWGICVGGGTAFSLILAVSVATLTHINLRKIESNGPGTN